MNIFISLLIYLAVIIVVFFIIYPYSLISDIKHFTNKEYSINIFQIKDFEKENIWKSLFTSTVVSLLITTIIILIILTH